MRLVTAGLAAALTLGLLAGCSKPEESKTAPTNPGLQQGSPAGGSPMGGAPTSVAPNRGPGQGTQAPAINPTLNR